METYWQESDEEEGVTAMSIFICGDIHGTYDIGKLQTFFCGKEELTKEDYLIICGDVAVCGFDRNRERETREFLKKLPVTTLFVDGNHENFDELNSYSEEEWHGGKVHIIESDIIHLMRGQIYEIEGKHFFTFGGAFSIDRDQRIEGLTWFPEEIPSEEEYEEAWENLKENDYEVDYVITHTAPFEVASELGFGSFDEAFPQAREFQRIADSVEFQDWFFGHFHVDEDVEQFHCLMDEVVVLDEFE